MPLPSLTSIAAVKAFAGITGAATDTVLEQLVTNASAFIRSYTSRDFTSSSYEITRSGRDTTSLQLPQYPITAVERVEVDGYMIPPASSVTQAGYRFDAEQLVLTGYRFNRGQLNVRILYTAGYAEVPADIAQACIELVTLKFRMRDKLEISSKSLANETISFTQRDMPASVKTTLNQAQRIAPL